MGRGQFVRRCSWTVSRSGDWSMLTDVRHRRCMRMSGHDGGHSLTFSEGVVTGPNTVFLTPTPPSEEPPR